MARRKPSPHIVKSREAAEGTMAELAAISRKLTVLTAEMNEEIAAAKKILSASGVRQTGVNLISCPTCGRTKYDMLPIAREVEERLRDCTKPITVAVMGCVVNGPGEARNADVGIAGGAGEGLLFRRGEVLRKVPQDKLVEALMEEIEKL